MVKSPLLHLTAITPESRGLFTGLRFNLIKLVGEKMVVKSLSSVDPNHVTIVLRGKIRITIEGNDSPDVTAQKAFEMVAQAIEEHYQVSEINIKAITIIQQNGELWLDVEISLSGIELQETLAQDENVFMHPGAITVTSDPRWHDCPRTFLNRPDLLRDNFEERI